MTKGFVCLFLYNLGVTYSQRLIMYILGMSAYNWHGQVEGYRGQVQEREDKGGKILTTKTLIKC